MHDNNTRKLNLTKEQTIFKTSFRSINLFYINFEKYELRIKIQIRYILTSYPVTSRSQIIQNLEYKYHMS